MLGSQIYTNPPRFIKGHATLLGLVIVEMAMTASAQLVMASANRKREKVVKKYEARGEGGVPDQDTSRCQYETADGL
jgi:hypothetical protein